MIPIVRTQNGGPKPSDPRDEVAFSMQAAHVGCYSVDLRSFGAAGIARSQPGLR